MFLTCYSFMEYSPGVILSWGNSYLLSGCQLMTNSTINGVPPFSTSPSGIVIAVVVTVEVFPD